MIETGEILQTMRMIQEENFDIRTITLGINLLDCSDRDAEKCAERVYDKICTKAQHLVRTGEEIETEFGIPIVNKRISVTPVSLICQADPRPIARATTIGTSGTTSSKDPTRDPIAMKKKIITAISR